MNWLDIWTVVWTILFALLYIRMQIVQRIRIVAGDLVTQRNVAMLKRGGRATFVYPGRRPLTYWQMVFQLHRWRLCAFYPDLCQGTVK